METKKKRVLVVGHGAREHVIVKAFLKSGATVFAYMEANNPFSKLCEKTMIGKYSDFGSVLQFVQENNVDFVFIGPEGPLEMGIVDFLESHNISCIGPYKDVALVETSKIFSRKLMKDHGIFGCPEFWVVKDECQLQNVFLYHHEAPFVIKPDGLTGGKGVQVEGDHFHDTESAMKVAHEYIKKDGRVLVERRLDGEEFVILFFCDGKTLVPMPVVRDYKRRFVDDEGLNTGSMGSYSCMNHSLPYLQHSDIKQAVDIAQKTVLALFEKLGLLYKGILYGSFIATENGVQVIEWNARFGDPECINVLSLLETDFVEICQAIIDGTLDKIHVEFSEQYTVCKYIVPTNYALVEDDPNRLASGFSDIIKIGEIGEAQLFYSSVFEDEDGLHMTSSRCLAVLGVAQTIEQAERIAEEAACSVSGNVSHRPDIGTCVLIDKSITHIYSIRGFG
ncbi:MAG: phosphoribosylamine--glycine ligase [Patescibacteria group bacterium]|nr:phosphoribosylamine--glycine ligase [Patescibacteria group bacterium]MDD4304193.1 phosphoribosylamine--glycine ligase [Patescibacteria group bacterium]MDD4695225.1 phosphoribosylamine--glycine ligase [Patescibacteria group bacterium]